MATGFSFRSLLPFDSGGGGSIWAGFVNRALAQRKAAASVEAPPEQADSDIMDAPAVAARQRAARRMAEGLNSTFGTSLRGTEGAPGFGLKGPPKAGDDEPIITTMHGRRVGIVQMRPDGTPVTPPTTEPGVRPAPPPPERTTPAPAPAAPVIPGGAEARAAQNAALPREGAPTPTVTGAAPAPTTPAPAPRPTTTTRSTVLARALRNLNMDGRRLVRVR
jgi:hypothetical protein